MLILYTHLWGKHRSQYFCRHPVVMSFVVVTHAPLSYHGGKIYGYAPYIREMNIWCRQVSSVIFVCPAEAYNEQELLMALEPPARFKHVAIPDFNLLGWRNVLKALPAMLVCSINIIWAMLLASHIHLRCPGNMGLLGCVWQIFFPWKPKTAKYAGNWDWKSRQPATYRWQQRILSNTWLTHRMQALVYGEWPGATRNIKAFFTATYSEADKVPTPPRSLQGSIQLMFAGTFSPGKQPLLSVQVVQALQQAGHPVVLHMFGAGEQWQEVNDYVQAHGLTRVVHLHGNQPAPIVKAHFQQSHFLLFISRSEGWPKVVAESMFWGCVPITSAVSCVPQMVGQGSRGTLVTDNVAEIVAAIENWLQHPAAYAAASQEGMEWSRQFTLEKFETEIVAMLGKQAPPNRH